MKICVLVKEVPDAAVEKRMDPNSKRLDRSGEKNLNPFDTHAIEAAMQVREGGAVDVDEIVMLGGILSIAGALFALWLVRERDIERSEPIEAIEGEALPEPAAA